MPRPEAWLQPLVGSPSIYRRFTRNVGAPGRALDDEAYADPRPGFEFSLQPKASSATGAAVAAAHGAAPGLFTTRCATHGLVVVTIPLYCRDTFLHPACCARTAEPHGDTRAGAPFFQRDDGSALTRGEVESLVRTAAVMVGEPQDRLTMHSGRAGMTTLLATAGFDAAYIKEYGFWSSEAYESYIRGTVFARCHPRPYYSPDRNIPVAEVLKLRGVEIAREWA